MSGALLLLSAALVALPQASIGLVGDIMLGHRSAPVLARNGYDYPFRATATLLRSFDALVGNLESPATDRGRPYLRKEYHFRADPAVLPALAEAGFDVLTFANNHSLDYGVEALIDTLARTTSAGIAFTGAGRNREEARRPARIVARGLRISVFAYNCTRPVEFCATDTRAGTAGAGAAYSFPEIRRERDNADFILAAFHWGGDYLPAPKPYQRTLARAAVAAGADAIVGHHPHVLQGIEIVAGKPVIYSTGNFAFGSLGFPPRRVATQGAVFELVLEGRAVREVRVHPLNVDNRVVHFCPAPARGDLAELILARYARLCRDLGTSLVPEPDGTAVVTLSGGIP
jgi:poly-gamma-glutamate synthesis protein (capsule biosynthesis protein)